MSDADKELAAIGYPQNILEAATQGVSFDARMRFAMELMKHAGYTPDLACADADFFFAACNQRGWIKPLDTNQPLPDDLAKHAERLGAFQMHQQVGANRAMQAEQGMVQAVRGKLNG